ncbi:MAG: flavodoxin family protein [Defluviitaleaceae bacterium]|nr:flavodoxin family protein [Defluviitaleaceae bacterium]
MITIIHGGHRNGLSHDAAETFKKILNEKGIETRLINLREHTFAYCCGNQPCQESGNCIHDDVMTNDFIPLITKSKAVAYFTPTYFNMPPAILKNFIDRCNLLLTVENKVSSYVSIWVTGGETVEDSLQECFNSIKTFTEICEHQLVDNGALFHPKTADEKNKIEESDLMVLEKLALHFISII